MIGFIGFGRMGRALAQGAVAANVVKPKEICGFDQEAKALAVLKKLGGLALKDNATVVAKSDIVFLCVKPQGMKEALASIQRPGTNLKSKCFVSIAAGIPISRLENWIGKGVAVFRVMPNTPALLSAGMSAVSRGKFGSASQERQIRKILSSVGDVVNLPEKFMDAVTAVSGSGPAYVFYLAESMIAGARRLGMSADIARRLVNQTIFGSGKMLIRRQESAEELRRQVTSPGGTTAAAIAHFESKDWKKIVEDAVKCAAQRSAQLAKT